MLHPLPTDHICNLAMIVDNTLWAWDQCSQGKMLQILRYNGAYYNLDKDSNNKIRRVTVSRRYCSVGQLL
jgi:hypothetical protein